MSIESLTYADLAGRLGTSHEAACSLVRRLRLPRQMGNDGAVRVNIDLAEIRHHKPLPQRSPRGHRGDFEAFKAQVEQLQAQVIKLETEKSSIDAVAVGHRADFERERERSDKLMTNNIVLRPEALIATALWTMTAWAHEDATHSPILAAISVEPDSGKSTLLGVLRFLVPKPFVSVEPTGPSVYRTVDREHPTLIIDEADDLFYRKSDLRAIVNAGWSRGTKIPRQGRWYDPFCPKILGILGTTKLPRTIASRSIILKMWPKKPDEKVENFAHAADPKFSTIRRKLARWAADNVRIIKDLKPPLPPGFNNRLSANWKLP